MKKSAFIITAINALIVGIQIIGQIIVARLFGAKIELDAFTSAVTIPTVLTTVIAATLSDAFLPIFKKRQIVDEKESNIYFFRISLVFSFFVLLATFVIDLASLPILNALFGVRGESFVLFSGQLMKYMLYTLPFTLLGTFAKAYFYTKRQFFLPSISYLLGSLLNLALIIVLSPTMGIVSMVVGFIVSIVFQFAIAFPYKIGTYLSLALKSLKLKVIIEESSKLLLAWSPLILISMILRFDSVIARAFSARLPEGYIVYVNLVNKLFGGLVGIMTIGIQTVFFPHLVELLHTKDIKKVVSQTTKAKFYGIAASLFAIAVILLTAPFFMRLILPGGKFSSQDVETLISMFPYFILPSLGWGISSIFFQPIIALGKQHSMIAVNIVAVALSWISAEIFYKYFGGLVAIAVGLTVLTFTGIIACELLWQKYKIQYEKS